MDGVERCYTVRGLLKALNANKTRVKLMWYVNLRGAGLAATARAVKRNGKITSMELSCTNITDAALGLLCKALKHCPNLEELRLFDNKITDVGCNTLCEALKHWRNFTVLDLGVNELTDVGALKLLETLKTCRNLEVLDLEGNELTDVVASKSFELLKTCGNLRYVNLGIDIDLHTCPACQNLNHAFVACWVWRPTLGMVCASVSSPVLKEFFRRDGDHAIWFEVVEFLVR